MASYWYLSIFLSSKLGLLPFNDSTLSLLPVKQSLSAVFSEICDFLYLIFAHPFYLLTHFWFLSYFFPRYLSYWYFCIIFCRYPTLTIQHSLRYYACFFSIVLILVFYLWLNLLLSLMVCRLIFLNNSFPFLTMSDFSILNFYGHCSESLIHSTYPDLYSYLILLQ